MALPEIDTERLPKHIAVIMDGNGRWAEKHGLSRAEGHEAGAKSARAIIEAARELGIQVLTLYAFSTENWRRAKPEVDALFQLLSKYIGLELDNVDKEDIRVRAMGRIEALPKAARNDFIKAEERTADNEAMIVNVALNYGSRREISDAAQAIAREVEAGRLSPEEIDEDLFAQHLYTADLPDPDLLIRTSGEMRLSNFMLWQLSYAELVVTRTLWPDFRKRHLHRAVAEYQRRQRRFGGR
jgi:undecaprenyl diphosphate synthase